MEQAFYRIFYSVFLFTPVCNRLFNIFRLVACIDMFDCNVYGIVLQPEDCEKAYFKMDNVLIDDRRIHVDFSQSVSKIKWKGKGE